MIKSLNKNIIDVKTFGLAVKTVKSYGQTVWERVKPTPVEFGGLKFTALESGEIGMTHNGTNATTTKPSLSYSKNGGSWVEWDYTNIPVVKDDVVYFKGINDRIGRSSSNYSTLTMTGKIASYGNIMSLLYGDDYEGKLSLSGKSYCFYKLFNKLSTLTTAPELPATTLAVGCYNNMFYGCTSLVTAPELPATTLAVGCYNNMFYGCTSLVTAPELPATELVNSCYTGMFGNCAKLNYVKANFLTEPSSTYTNSWLSRVSSTGTFVPNPEATWPSTVTRGTSTVPEGWTIYEEYKGLTFTAMEDDCSITYQNSDKTSAEYSKDGVNWKSYNGNISSDGSISSFVGIRLNKGEKLYVRGTIDPAGQSLAKHTKFVIRGNVSASGNINSLNNNSDVLPPAAYADLFNGCTSLMSAPELPSVNLSSQCYYRMFKGCTNLNYIKANFVTDPSNTTNKYTYEWLDGVALIGTFVANPEATWTDTVTRGTSTVPENWTIQK